MFGQKKILLKAIHRHTATPSQTALTSAEARNLYRGGLPFSSSFCQQQAAAGERGGGGYSRLFFDGSVRPPIEKRPSLPIPFRRLTFCIIDSSSFSFFLPSSVRSAIGHLSMGEERQNGGGGCRGLPLRKRRGGPKVRYDDDGGREKKAKRRVEDNFMCIIFSGV